MIIIALLAPCPLNFINNKLLLLVSDGGHKSRESHIIDTADIAVDKIPVVAPVDEVPLSLLSSALILSCVLDHPV